MTLSLSSCHSATLVGTASGSLLLSLLSPSFSTTLVVSNFSLFRSNLTWFNFASLIRWRFVTVSRSDLFFLLVFVQESAGEREQERGERGSPFDLCLSSTLSRCFFIQASMQLRKQGRPNRRQPLETTDLTKNNNPSNFAGDLWYSTPQKSILSRCCPGSSP